MLFEFDIQFRTCNCIYHIMRLKNDKMKWHTHTYTQTLYSIENFSLFICFLFGKMKIFQKSTCLKNFYVEWKQPNQRRRRRRRRRRRKVNTSDEEKKICVYDNNWNEVQIQRHHHQVSRSLVTNCFDENVGFNHKWNSTCNAGKESLKF